MGQPPNPPDLLTRRVIFDKLVSKTSPTASTFVGEVMDMVCEMKDVTQGKNLITTFQNCIIIIIHVMYTVKSRVLTRLI